MSHCPLWHSQISFRQINVSFYFSLLLGIKSTEPIVNSTLAEMCKVAENVTSRRISKIESRVKIKETMWKSQLISISRLMLFMELALFSTISNRLLCWDWQSIQYFFSSILLSWILLNLSLIRYYRCLGTYGENANTLHADLHRGVVNEPYFRTSSFVKGCNCCYNYRIGKLKASIYLNLARLSKSCSKFCRGLKYRWRKYHMLQYAIPNYRSHRVKI